MKLPDGTAAVSKPLRDPRLTAINFVSDAVNRTLDLKEIADNALDAVLAVMKVDAGAVYIWQDGDQALHMFAWRGLSEAFVRRVTVLQKGQETIDAVMNGEARVIEDFTTNREAFRVDAVEAGFQSAMLVPIRAHGFVVGMLGLGTHQARKFAETDVDLIEAVSNQIGNAMVHAQLQTDLRASEEQYRALVENSDDAIYIADATGRPRYANSAFPRIFGYALYEVVRGSLFEHVHPEDAEMVHRAFDALLRGEAIHNLEYRFRHKEGMWIDVQCSGSVFSRDGERVSELQFIVRDITQAKQRRQQLLRRNQQLSALTTLAAVANSSLNIDEIARNTLEVALESTGMNGGGIHLADVKQHVLHLYLQSGLPDEFVAAVRTLKWGESVPGLVAASGQAVVVDDFTVHAAAVPSIAAEHGFRASIVVPVKAKGELLGTLGLVNRHELAFTPEVVEMVTAMGNQLGIAVANARLYERQLRENEKLTALVDISSGTAQQLELEPLLQRILERAAALLKADGAYMSHYDAASEQAQIVATSADFAKLVGMLYPSTQGLFGQIRVQRQGKVFTRMEIQKFGYSAVLRESDIQSALVVPLISRNELIGAVSLTRHGANAAEFTAANLDLMEAFASRAAVAIDNAQLLKDLGRKNELLQLLIEEAHHRIKNNLQMVSGLLQLEADTAVVDSSKEFLRTAITRIQAIAQVHNLLSEEMPEKVDAHTLITTIVHTLISSAARVKGTPEVTVEVEHIWLGADQAVPLALIVNELLSNSFLHGRPSAGQALCARVECRQLEGHVQLVVTDNGGGFGDGKDWRDFEGQGMNIVAQLAQVNLRGHLQIDSRDGGVCAALRFEVVAHGPGPAARSLWVRAVAGA